MQLRPYQKEAVQAVHNARLIQGINRQLIALPTGMGKTVVFNTLAREMNTRTLILAHREELLEQAKDKMQQVWPGADVGILNGSSKEYDNQITVASVQTVGRKDNPHLDRLGNNFGLVIVDEAHHATSDSYKYVLNRVGSFQKENLLTLGVTATPKRGDGKALKDVFQKITYSKDIIWGIENQYLCDLIGVSGSLDIDLGKVRKTAGDFNDGDLSRELMNAHADKFSLDAYEKYAKGRKGIVFTPTVKNAVITAQTFNEAGIPSTVISGETPRDERKELLRKFARGDIQVIANCGVLTEGFDQDDVSVIIIARPTQSEALYQQMVGRGTRLANDKENCVVIDLVGNSGRHELKTMATLYGAKQGESIHEAKERIEREAKEARKAQKASTGIPDNVSIKYKVKAIVKKSKFHWIPFSEDRFFVSLADKGALWIFRDPQDTNKWYLSRKKTRNGLLGVYKSLEDAMKDGDAHIKNMGRKTVALANKNAKWRKRTATSKQIKALNRRNIHCDLPITSGQAADLLSKEYA